MYLWPGCPLRGVGAAEQLQAQERNCCVSLAKPAPWVTLEQCLEMRGIIIPIVEEADKIRGRGAAAGEGRQRVRGGTRGLWGWRWLWDNVPGAAAPRGELGVSREITQGCFSCLLLSQPSH